MAFTPPFAYLMWIGMRDAGEETMSPRKEHEFEYDHALCRGLNVS